MQAGRSVPREWPRRRAPLLPWLRWSPPRPQGRDIVMGKGRMPLVSLWVERSSPCHAACRGSVACGERNRTCGRDGVHADPPFRSSPRLLRSAVARPAGAQHARGGEDDGDQSGRQECGQRHDDGDDPAAVEEELRDGEEARRRSPRRRRGRASDVVPAWRARARRRAARWPGCPAAAARPVAALRAGSCPGRLPVPRRRAWGLERCAVHVGPRGGHPDHHPLVAELPGGHPPFQHIERRYAGDRPGGALEVDPGRVLALLAQPSPGRAR